jgi:hypothetical protein
VEWNLFVFLFGQCTIAKVVTFGWPSASPELAFGHPPGFDFRGPRSPQQRPSKQKNQEICFERNKSFSDIFYLSQILWGHPKK